MEHTARHTRISRTCEPDCIMHEKPAFCRTTCCISPDFSFVSRACSLLCTCNASLVACLPILTPASRKEGAYEESRASPRVTGFDATSDTTVASGGCFALPAAPLQYPCPHTPPVSLFPSLPTLVPFEENEGPHFFVSLPEHRPRRANKTC